MFYSKQIKILTLLISILIVLISILSCINIIKNFNLLKFCLILFGVEQVLLAYNSYKLNKSLMETLLLCISGIILIGISIVIM